MCGIFGVFNISGQLLNQQLIEEARDVLSHRGPDDAGVWVNHNVALAHRRLSIIDLTSAGHQPYFSDDERYVLTFNGEIYNYISLRTMLESKGYNFTTNTDTEVLLKMYIEFGDSCLNYFNGMFAFAIWDNQEKELFFARDRVGVKPFYYSFDNTEFIFSSEQKAIFKYSKSIDIDEKYLNEVVFFRHVSGDNTLYKNVKKLLPGCFGRISANKAIQIEKWWNLGERISAHPTISKPFEWFDELFHDSIKLRMISDVKVGVLLSAGLDSTSVLQTIKDLKYSSIQSFNVGFTNLKHDESELARTFCEGLGYEFNKLLVEDSKLYNSVVESTFFHDEPLMHYNDPQILALSKFAKQKVSVLLSGEGADEIMGGYLRYKPIQFLKHKNLISIGINLLSMFVGNKRLIKLKQYYSLNDIDMMLLFNGVSIFPDEIKSNYKIDLDDRILAFRVQILNEAKKVYPNNYVRQLLYLDQHTYLQSLNDRNDRATMGASIECREPFMDYRIMEGVGTLDNDYLFKGKKNKFLLFNSIGLKLPNYIRDFRKVGFSVPWVDFFLNDPSFRETIEKLPTCDLFKMDTFRHLDVLKIKNEFIKNGSNSSLVIQLFFFAVWYENYFSKIKESIYAKNN